MSSKQDSYDQAEKLRKRMEKNHLILEEKEGSVTNASKLPPRSEVHRNKDDKKIKIRIRYPIVRLLVLIFIVLVTIIPGYYYWNDNVQPVDTDQNSNNATNNNNVDVIEMQNKQPLVEDEFVIANPEDEESDEIATTEEEAEKNDQKNVVDDTESSESIQSPKEQFIIHRVKPGETLYRVSMKYFKSREGEELIKKANHLDENGTIYSGQRLKIPVQNK